MKLPATFGKYELLSQIGTGGMAEIYLARAFGVAGFEKRLVIKRIRHNLAQDPRFIKLFINEAKIGVDLNHPNIVQMYDLGRVGPIWYMAMELLQGRDLNKIVKRFRGEQKKLPLNAAVAIVAETCRGLAHAHSHKGLDGETLGLVHRDVSPHNIVLTLTGEVKLVDFGVARLMNTTQATEAGLAPGRPGGGKYAYMSPEQAQGLEVDHRTDVYSAGIVLWELIVGHRLYQDPDPSEKLRRVVEAVVPHPKDEGVEIDDELWRIVQKALAKDREDRYESADLFEEDLRAWLFHNGAQEFREDIAKLVRRAFPDDQISQQSTLDLHRMAQDVDQLDPAEETQSAHTPGISEPVTEPPSSTRNLRAEDGERKTVAVVIVDMDGLTDLSMRIEPEMLFKRHYQVLRWLRRIVDRYGGVLQRAVDDQILLLFGVPKTQKDDLARALECAMELRRSVDELLPKGLHLHLAIGIHTGDVTIGTGRKQVRYVARGNTTRLARRLSNIADHGEILVSNRVLETAEIHFLFEAGPEVANRGGRPATPSFRLTGRKHGLRVAGKGPWLRRGNELEVIRSKLVSLAEKEGGIVWLTGEVGTGKSRLLKELRSVSGKRNVPLYTGCCAPYGENPPLEPFRDLLADLLNVEPEQRGEDFDESLEFLGHLGLSQEDLEAIRHLLLRITSEKYGQASMWRAIEQIFVGLCEDCPFIVALEDTHYLNENDLNALLKTLTRLTSGHPILFILTRRGDVPTEHQNIGDLVALGPFEIQTQQRMIRHFIDAEEIEPEVTEILLRTCEGNPRYLEEMIKYLLREKRIVVQDGIAKLFTKKEDSNLPNSLAALIAARIDALDQSSKGALQLAATIGHTFSARLLGEAMGLDHPKPLMTRLSQHGLVLRTSNENKDQWSFASELVRECAERGILGFQRRKYNQLLASAIESLYADDLDPWYHTLSRHCAKGNRPLDAASYAFKSGLRFQKQQSLHRALKSYKSGLMHLSKVKENPETWDARVQGEANLHLKLGTTYELLADHSAAQRHLSMALDIASDSGLPWIEAKAHMQLGRLFTSEGQISLAEAHVDEARILGRLQKDPEIQLEALQAAAFLAQEQGQSDTAHSLWKEALELAGEDSRTAAHCYVGMANQSIRRAETDSAKEMLEKALELANETDDRILIGRILNNLGLLHVWYDEYDSALERFRDALNVREGIGYTIGVIINHHNIGDVHFRKGDWARAWVSFQRSHELAESVDWKRGIALNEVFLGYIEAHRDGNKQALQRILNGIDLGESLEDGEIITNGLLLAGRLFLETDKPKKAKAFLNKAKRSAKNYGLVNMEQHIQELLDAVSGA